MTPAEVNALPEPVRTYVFDLETRCDPSGDVQRIASLTEQRDALVILLQERDATIADLRAQVAEAEAKGRREMRDYCAWLAQNGWASPVARDIAGCIRALPDTAPERTRGEG